MSELLNTFDEQPILSMEPDHSGYEVITSDEVDKVVSAIEQLMKRVQSENIRTILDEAADEVYSLVYSEASEELESEAA